jgi:protein gp37
MGSPNYQNGFKLTLQPQLLNLPYTWRKPRKVFVNSMSDLMHPDVPDEYIVQVFEVMNDNLQHRFQLLTKRPERLASIEHLVSWTANIWMGVTVENDRFLSRVDLLRDCGAEVKFLSLEPLLGPLSDLALHEIDWAIVGGESGPKARPMEAWWATELRDKCVESSVPFFFKQWGGVQKHRHGRLLEGREWNQIPGEIEVVSA